MTSARGRHYKPYGDPADKAVEPVENQSPEAEALPSAHAPPVPDTPPGPQTPAGTPLVTVSAARKPGTEAAAVRTVPLKARGKQWHVTMANEPALQVEADDEEGAKLEFFRIRNIISTNHPVTVVEIVL